MNMDEVARVTRAGGFYRLSYSNPYIHGMAPESWNGTGCAAPGPYVHGAEVVYQETQWDFQDGDGKEKRLVQRQNL